MAIRVRRVNGVIIAVCAAETDEVAGDLYLDDAVHYALSMKFGRDYQGVTVGWSESEHDRLNATQITKENPNLQ